MARKIRRSLRWEISYTHLETKLACFKMNNMQRMELQQELITNSYILRNATVNLKKSWEYSSTQTIDFLIKLILSVRVGRITKVYCKRETLWFRNWWETLHRSKINIVIYRKRWRSDKMPSDCWLKSWIRWKEHSITMKTIWKTKTLKSLDWAMKNKCCVHKSNG